jgi:hypothetical protein
MNSGFPRLITLSLLLALAVAIIPVSVQAQTATVGPVSPASIVNDMDTTINVSGSGFDSTAVVFLDAQALATTFVDPQTLKAVVPAGVAPGTHAVTVTMTSLTVTGFANLNVTAPSLTSTPVPAPAVRPQIGVQSYRTKPAEVRYGQDLKLSVKLKNKGGAAAFNVQVSFTSSSFLPLKNGGVNIVGDLPADAAVEVDQPMTASTYLYGLVSIDMNLSYSDANGVAYTEKFTLNLQASGGGGGSYATSTPTGVKSSQLVITSYAASLDPLQPGEQFNLAMTVQNTGNVRAQRVTMIVGGGSSGTTSLTPQPGGVSGGSGEFTNFAPVGASNVQTLGDLGAGEAIQAKQDLIVNVSTNPGAYPMKVTFSYLNDKGEVINDDQVITLLVYSLPTVDVSFYRPPDPFYVGQPSALPIQVVNLGKRASVLGTIKITSANGTVENGTGLVGSLDAGGYFTLDAMVTPEQSGKMNLDITIDYTDDFNQPRTIARKLEIEVMEGMLEPTPDPSLGGGGGGAEIPIPTHETTLQKVWRFVLGILGLDSAPPSNGNPEISPGPEQPVVPVPRPGTGKG